MRRGGSRRQQAGQQAPTPSPQLSLHKFPPCDICQEKAAFIFCVEDRALLCRDCDEAIHAANTLSANHQRFLATGIRVALSSSTCNKEVQKNQSEPSNQQSAGHLPTQQSSNSPPLWPVDDFFHFSGLESCDKKGQMDDIGELEWLADVGLFGDQLHHHHEEEEALPAAEVPQLPVSQLNHIHSYRPIKSNVSYKKPRLEIQDHDDEEHSIVPDLG